MDLLFIKKTSPPGPSQNKVPVDVKSTLQPMRDSPPVKSVTAQKNPSSGE
jgi:hypothetical protein